MTIYLTVFFLSSLFFYVSEKAKGKYLKRISVIVAILVPSILAGTRASTVGTDTSVYGISFFERAVYSNGIIDYITKQIALGNVDVGFNGIVYFASRLSKDYHVGLFFYELITLIFIYLFFRECKLRYDTPIWLASLLYNLALYNTSLNIMRQNIAVAVAAYAFTFVWKNKKISYFVLMTIAFLIHSSALVGLIPFVLYMFLKTGTVYSERKQFFRCVVFVCIAFGVILGAPQLIEFLVKAGIFRDNYLKYLQGGTFSTASEGRSVSMVTLTIQLIYIMIYTVLFRKMLNLKIESSFYLMISAMVLVTTCFGPLFAEYVSRLSYYFIPIQMAGLATTKRLFNKKSQPIWEVVIIGIVLFSWYRTFVILGYHETVPYVFYWGK